MMQNIPVHKNVLLLSKSSFCKSVVEAQFIFSPVADHYMGLRLVTSFIPSLASPHSRIRFFAVVTLGSFRSCCSQAMVSNDLIT